MYDTYVCLSSESATSWAFYRGTTLAPLMPKCNHRRFEICTMRATTCGATMPVRVEPRAGRTPPCVEPRAGRQCHLAWNHGRGDNATLRGTTGGATMPPCVEPRAGRQCHLAWNHRRGDKTALHGTTGGALRNPPVSKIVAPSALYRSSSIKDRPNIC